MSAVTGSNGGKKKKHVNKYSDAILLKNKKRKAKNYEKHLEKAAARRLRNHSGE